MQHTFPKATCHIRCIFNIYALKKIINNWKTKRKKGWGICKLETRLMCLQVEMDRNEFKVRPSFRTSITLGSYIFFFFNGMLIQRSKCATTTETTNLFFCPRGFFFVMEKSFLLFSFFKGKFSMMVQLFMIIIAYTLLNVNVLLFGVYICSTTFHLPNLQ